MTDPTIPELVARLRELHAAMRSPEPRLDLAVECMRAIGDRALPTLLDALDHIGDANKMDPHSPDGGKVDGPELVSSAIADTGDYDVACSVCHEERDEPHTWRECAAQLQREIVRLVDALCGVQAPSRALLRQVWQTAHAAGMLVGDKTVREVAEQRERDLDHFLSYPPGSFDNEEARRG